MMQFRLRTDGLGPLRVQTLLLAGTILPLCQIGGYLVTVTGRRGFSLNRGIMALLFQFKQKVNLQRLRPEGPRPPVFTEPR